MKMTAKKPDKISGDFSFKEKKALIEAELEADKIKHSLRMEELGYIRETERRKHEWELERGRIKTAEIRKTIFQKEMAKK